MFPHPKEGRRILSLGGAESIGTATDLFVPVDGKTRLYRRLDPALRAEPVEFPSSFAAALPGATLPRSPKPLANLQALADQLLLQRCSPPAVLVNDKGDILSISGRTGKYLEPAAGKANWNVFAMAREGLRYELNGAFKKALQQKGKIHLRGLRVGADGGAQIVDVTIQAIREPEPLRGTVMVVFTEMAAHTKPKPPPKSKQAPAGDPSRGQFEQEVQHLREESQATREARQTSQEGLKPSNEELQSTNEVLTASKEEMPCRTKSCRRSTMSCRPRWTSCRGRATT